MSNLTTPLSTLSTVASAALATAAPTHAAGNSTPNAMVACPNKSDNDWPWIVTVFMVLCFSFLSFLITYNLTTIRLLNEIRTTPPELREAVMKGMRQGMRMKNPDAEYLDPKDVVRLYGGKG